MPMSPRLLRPRQVGGFDPRRISGIGGWFDATDASTYTLDTGVSEWRCKAVSGQKFSQSVGASQPTINATGINGKAALSFDSSNDFMTLGSQTIGGNSLMCEAGNAFTLMMVMVNSATNTAGKTFFSKAGVTQGNRTLQLFVASQTSLQSVLRGSSVSTVASFPNATAGLMLFNWNESIAAGRFNASTGTGTVGSAAVESENILLGVRSESSPTTFYQGLISEIIFYNKTLSASEQSALFAYLNAKWGLSLT